MEDQEVVEGQLVDDTSDAAESQALAASVKKMFFSDVEPVYSKPRKQIALPENKTIYDLAGEQGITVLEFVQQDPESRDPAVSIIEEREETVKLFQKQK